MRYKADFEAIAWETPVKGVRHKVLKQGNKQLRLVEYTQAMESHWCEKGHLGYILEGQMEISFDSDTIVYGPGNGVFIPSGRNHRHMGRALTEFVRAIFVEDV